MKPAPSDGLINRLLACLLPILAGTMIQFFGGIQHTAMILGTVYPIGLVVP